AASGRRRSCPCPGRSGCLPRACACSPCPAASRRAPPWMASCRSFRGLLDGRAGQLGGGVLNGLHDVLVAGAAAEIAGDAEPDLVLARVRILLQQAVGPHDHAGRAIAALQPMHLAETLL